MPNSVSRRAFAAEQNSCPLRKRFSRISGAMPNSSVSKKTACRMVSFPW